MLPLEASRWDGRGPVRTAGVCRASPAVWPGVTCTACASSLQSQAWPSKACPAPWQRQTCLCMLLAHGKASGTSGA